MIIILNKSLTENKSFVKFYFYAGSVKQLKDQPRDTGAELIYFMFLFFAIQCFPFYGHVLDLLRYIIVIFVLLFTYLDYLDWNNIISTWAFFP